MQRSSRYHNHRHNQRSQSLNRGQALSQADVSGMWWHRGASGKGELMFRARTRTETNNKLIHPAGSAASCANCAMGNKLSCSCAPLMRKAYRYEDSPWQSSRRRDGHLLRWVMVLTFGTEPLLYVNCWLPKTRAPTTNATTNNWTTIEFALSIACFKPTNCFFFWFFFLSQKKKKKQFTNLRPNQNKYTPETTKKKHKLMRPNLQTTTTTTNVSCFNFSFLPPTATTTTTTITTKCVPLFVFTNILPSNPKTKM